MLVCIIVIIIILIILIIASAVYYSTYSNQSYVYYDGQYYYNGSEEPTNMDQFNRGQRGRQKQGFLGNYNNHNDTKISTINDIPYQFGPYASAERALLNRNILAAQGNSIPEFYRWQPGANSSYLPENGGQDTCINETDCIGKGSSYTCSGLGDNVSCVDTSVPAPQPNPTISHFQNSPLDTIKNAKDSKKIDDIKNNELMFGKYKRNGSSLSNLEQQSNLPRGLDSYHRSGAKLTPEDNSQADQEMWLASYMDNKDPQNDSGLGNDLPSSTHIPSGDYMSYITNLVADPRLQENHHKWSEEMSPWSGTAFSPDDLDEAVGNDLSFVGLRRPQAIAQSSDALFITEADATNVIDNPRFNFMGNTLN